MCKDWPSRNFLLDTRCRTGLDKGAIWSEVLSEYSAWNKGGGGSNVYLCTYCDISYQEERSLFAHVLVVHSITRGRYVSDNPRFVVDGDGVCGLCHKRAELLASHLRVEHPRVCSVKYFAKFAFQGGNV